MTFGCRRGKRVRMSPLNLPHRVVVSWLGLTGLSLVACDSPAPSGQGAQAPSNAQNSAVTVGSPLVEQPAAVAVTTGQGNDEAPSREAALGKPAPDFTLIDLDGKQVRLGDFKGKTVVLEWFNPECPFVRLSHSKGSLRDAAKRHSEAGVTWLAINSAAPGKQGHAPETNRKAVNEFSMRHPLLVDESGSVGRMYKAQRTPHMYVIDAAGTLVYRGAIDNSPDGEGASPQGGRLVRYVDQALAEVAAGKPVSVPDTEAYGCSVKYGS